MALFAVGATTALIAGLLLLVIARRGMRIDDHPVCQRCRFDLSGVFPRVQVCPECGRGLESPRSIRIGNRRRRRGMHAAGLATAIAALLLTATAITILLTGSALNRYKPSWLLLNELAGRNGGIAEDSLDELMARHGDEDLADRQIARIIGTLLERHADAADQLNASWAMTIDFLASEGHLSGEQIGRYLSQGMASAVRARAVVETGAPIPIELAMALERLAVGRSFMVEASVVGLRLGSHDLGTHTLEYPFARGQGPGARAPRTDDFFVPADSVPVGQYQLTGTLRLVAREGDWNGLVEGSVFHATIERPFEVPVEISGNKTVTVVEPTKGLRAAMQRSFVGRTILVFTHPDRVGYQLSLTGNAPPIGGAYDVFVRLPDGSEIESDVPHPFLAGQDMTWGITRQSGGGLGGAAAVDAVLRPSVEAAANTIDLFEVWGEEILVEGVPVMNPGG